MHTWRHVADENQAPAAAQLVHARVGDDPVQPGGEPGVLTEGRRGPKDLHKNLLSDVLGRGVVALQEVEGDRENAVLVALEHATLRLGVAAAAAFEGVGVDLRLRHKLNPHVCGLDDGGLRFLPFGRKAREWEGAGGEWGDFPTSA